MILVMWFQGHKLVIAIIIILNNKNFLTNNIFQKNIHLIKKRKEIKEENIY